MPTTTEQLMRAAKGLTLLAQDIAIPKTMDPPLTPGEMSVMGILVARAEPTSVSELVKKSQLAQSRVSSVVKSLERRGWVVISTPSHDRRATLVHARKEVIESARKVLATEIAPHVAKHLDLATPAELKTILRGLDVLVEVLDRQAESR